jgi:hypothetical protein
MLSIRPSFLPKQAQLQPNYGQMDCRTRDFLFRCKRR